jgi:glyoxylase-like metal-dependent hydrolase (beta-lactamase superfamily II)
MLVINMKKSYVTTMPNHIGAFLQASKCFANLGINITRVSYNKAVDSHTLFIDAEGEEAQLNKAERELEKIGYISNSRTEPAITLLEFRIKDEPGGVTEVLELIQSYNLNISYISSQQNDSEYQMFKMGLLADDQSRISDFMEKAKSICTLRVIDYNRSEKVFDNSIFYNSFVSSLIDAGGISAKQKNELLVNTNLAMQMLDEQGKAPYRTFDAISRFADMIATYRKEKFCPRITTHSISADTEIIVIEPPCGSNTMIIKSCGQYLFVDSGYAYYRDEMTEIIKGIIPDFDTTVKRIVLTHADVDHMGLLPMFDEIIVSDKTARCIINEAEGKDGYREENPYHKPYVKICKALTNYSTPDPDKLRICNKSISCACGVMWQIGVLSVGELNFEVYEGAGGHLPGEIVLIDYDHRITFTGDIYINLHGLIPEQAEYNKYAPKLMNSVDTDPKLCTKERKAILQRLGAGDWLIFGSHGEAKEYNVKV